MNFDAIPDAWRSAGEPPSDPAAELAGVRARAAALERGVRRRDWLETGAALLLVPIFAWLALTTSSALSAAGAAIVVVAAIMIPIRLRWARRAAPDPTLPVAQLLEAEVTRLRRQERLLMTAAWWYFAPLAAGAVLFVAGTPVPVAMRIGYAVLVAILSIALVGLTRRAARARIHPLIRELEGWLADFRSNVQ